MGVYERCDTRLSTACHSDEQSCLELVEGAFVESFHDKFRAQCLNQHWFMSLNDATQKYETGGGDYNEAQPHGAIGNKAPISLMNRLAAHGPPLPSQTG